MNVLRCRYQQGLSVHPWKGTWEDTFPDCLLRRGGPCSLSPSSQQSFEVFAMMSISVFWCKGVTWHEPGSRCSPFHSRDNSSRKYADIRAWFCPLLVMSIAKPRSTTRVWDMRQYDKLPMEAPLRSTQFLPQRTWPLPPCPITCLLILGIWICSPNTRGLFPSSALKYIFVFYANQTLFISLFNNLKSAHFFTAAGPTPKTHPCSAYAISQRTKLLTKGIFGTSLWAVSASCSLSYTFSPFPYS